MNHLELFSGTHSFGKVTKKKGYNVISLDRDLGGKCPFTNYDNSNNHIQEDIMTWDYKIYPKGYFKLITASPVCLWWSICRLSWIGRKLKAHGTKIITAEILDKDPEFYIIENPQTGKMKHYINDLIPYYDLDYCIYGFDYRKTTRFWTNIELQNINRCNHKKHKLALGHQNHGTTKLERYKIPEKLIENILENLP